MANYVICLLVQRLILPLVLMACFLFRPVLLSLPYLLFLLYLPFVPVATIKSMRGHTGVYLGTFIGVSVILVILQIAFQIVVGVIGSDFLAHCEFLEKLFRHLGFIKLQGVPWQQWILWLYPEILAFITSVCVYCALQNLVIGHLAPLEEGEERAPLSERPDYDAGPSQEQLSVLMSIGKLASIVFLLFAAVFHPSAINGIYFLVFLGAATWWSCAKELERGFGIVLRCTMVVFVVHILTFMVYQTPWPQEFLDKNSTVARVLGFTPLIQSSCNETSSNLTLPLALTETISFDDTTTPDPTNVTSTTPAPIIEPINDIRVIQFAEYNADYYLNPIFLILCYYTIALTSSLLLQPKLMRGGTRKIRDIKVQATPGVPTVPGDVIQMEEMGTTPVPEDEHTTFGEQLLSGLNNVISFIYQNSYIFTNVVMMSWSIVYHSWFGFVYLIWANLIWILPKQRMNMLRSSPFLVLYAEVLLLINYIYGMDLTEEELPSWVKTQGISLEQIGIIRVKEYPCLPLILKSTFTGMFWITLRQMIQEKKAQRKSSTLADMVAPLTVTVSPATSALSRRQEPKSSEFVTKLGNIINAFLVKGWIWVVAITLFIFGISGGDKMTMFRITYMALFLFFVITFQLSLETWRKVLYGFWLAVIIYSMLILILVYTYQFDRFDEHWQNITHISIELQHDIGLEKYETKQLFLHLLTPTLIVIITVIQLHYCHKKFLQISEIPSRPDGETETQVDETDSNSIYGGIENSEEEENVSRRPSKRLKLVEKMKNRTLTKKDFNKALKIFVNRVLELTEYGWVFLEIHFLKIIMVVAFYLAVQHVRFLHIIFAAVAALGVGCRSQSQILASKIASLFCSILLILMMIYQIEYIKEEDYAYNCHPNATMPNQTMPETRTVLNNTAIWFGFIKSSPNNPLSKLIRPYLVYIVIVTVHSVVTLRQTIRRIRLGQPVQPAKLLFPKIVRKDADKDIPHLIMYLFNYGFYKFGVEISLVMLTFVIGRRMDIYALLYAFWLCGLFTLDRAKLSKIWGSLRWFLVGSITIQYLTFVGLPPRLCIDYPWTTRLFDGFQIWAMLPDNTIEFRSRSYILLSDFVLLLVVCRQLIVFRIEEKYKNNANDYSGGSNQSVVKDIDELGQVPFTNPTPDFVEKIRNWLDISKRILFLVFFWITLAIVFLAGTNRVNLFSIGYLVGSFTFLWQGTDFYLRPIRLILKWWNMLIGYTVFVISLKAFLQIAGCFYIKDLMGSYCGLVQLLGISCICYPKAIDASDLEKCKLEIDDVKLLWDGVCFAFLLMQKRVFSSHYFCHIINETKASTILASRGAELIEELRAKEMKVEQEHEIEVLQKLKAKMDRIKATQQKLLESVKEPPHHAKGARLIGQRFVEPRAHAIRSGDYYMFDALEDEYKLEEPEDKDELTEEEKKTKTGRRLSRKMTLGQDDETTEAGLETEAGIVTQFDDPQPSTSKSDSATAEEEEMSKLIEEDKIRKSRLHFSGLNLVLTFINSFLVSLTIRLHRISRNYRFVMRVLAKEKRNLKNKPGFGAGMRIGTSMVWTPQAASRASSRKGSIVPEIRVLAPSLERGLDDDQSLKDEASISSPEKHEEPEVESDEEDFASKEHNILVELLIAAWYAVLSHTDFICYLCVFLNQINSASILSLPLPLLVLLWGTLTFPRPSKTFWITLIAYTQVVVLLKCISQFDSLWWNEVALTDNEPFAASRIIGIEKKKGYATHDLILLLVVFCHRFILKSLGLWKSDFTDDSLQEGLYKAEANGTDDKKENGSSDERLYIVKQDDVEVKLKKVDSEAQLGSHGSNDVVVVTKTVEEPSNYCPGIIKLSFQKYLSSTRAFYLQLIDRRSRKTADVYTLLFLCDFINFFVILFGFSAFGTAGGDASVLSYFEENKVPVTFLFMLIIQFFLIVIDRALYLRKYMIGKIIFQFFLIIGLHIWMFFILPATTERRFNSSNPPIVYYLIKCGHLLFSAYQIRCGYPARILGNFITKGYSLFNNVGFKVFMNIPFLFELRTLMDWVWTDTSFSVFDWLKMEDIFANVYQLKCSRVFEDRMPVPRGQKRKPMIKYLMGGFMVMSLIILIWFPLALFAFSSAVGEPNIPFDVSISLRIGPYEPVYTMSAQNSKIYELKRQEEWERFLSPYNKDKSALTFLTSYEGADVAATELGSNSATIWNISPPDKERLIEDINGSSKITVRLRYTVSRITHSKEVPGVLSEEQQYEIKPEDHEIRDGLSKMLNQSDADVNVTFPFLFPKFVKVKTSDMKTVHQLTPGSFEDNQDSTFRNITIKLFQNSVNGSTQTWWAVNEVTNDKFYDNFISKLPYAKADALVVYLFNDKIFPQTLSSVAAGGIISMYVIFVLAAFFKIRGFLLGAQSKIMFEDLPNVDRILQLCLDVYVVREAREFALEEDLFAKLIFLYRSPETLIKWTRLEEEHEKTD
ncbi:piezo-type mechanosensitive ion channel component isoform X4 [Culicoides brevitarsis]|uniref:piezo-type mechanosensitive ion channel component isoform X4 n=1 Tax=Culicoides brevitarsis TaxID=469753 RepID=UPI00307C5C17